MNEEYDWGPELHQAAETHLEAVIEADWLQEEAGDDFDVDSPACAPFCGCTTCTVREVLYGAYPVIRRMVQLAAQTGYGMTDGASSAGERPVHRGDQISPFPAEPRADVVPRSDSA